MTCLRCNSEIVYRKQLCRRCYKQFRLKQFHCTYRKCYKPVFSTTLCQFHYRCSQMSCILCSNKIYCRSLCRKHYNEKSVSGDFPVEPTCYLCNKTVYIQNICIYHFKKKYDSGCIMIGCNQKSFRRGLCCRHYFKERRRIENKNRI